MKAYLSYKSKNNIHNHIFELCRKNITYLYNKIASQFTGDNYDVKLYKIGDNRSKPFILVLLRNGNTLPHISLPPYYIVYPNTNDVYFTNDVRKIYDAKRLSDNDILNIYQNLSNGVLVLNLIYLCNITHELYIIVKDKSLNTISHMFHYNYYIYEINTINDIGIIDNRHINKVKSFKPVSCFSSVEDMLTEYSYYFDTNLVSKMIAL